METVYKQSEKNSKTENFRVAIKENYLPAVPISNLIHGVTHL